MMRAKLLLTNVERISEEQERLRFCAVGGQAVEKGYPDDGSDEDNTYAKFSPMADLELHVNNPKLIGQFSEGDKFYVDFTKVAE